MLSIKLSAAEAFKTKWDNNYSGLYSKLGADHYDTLGEMVDRISMASSAVKVLKADEYGAPDFIITETELNSIYAVDYILEKING